MKIKWDNDKLDMTDLLSFTAREPSLALAFNYASSLINNSYFLEGIVRTLRPGWLHCATRTRESVNSLILMLCRTPRSPSPSPSTSRLSRTVLPRTLRASLVAAGSG